MTGCIRNHVIISPSPISVWLLGAVCVPSAWRRIDNTMMMRVKAVIASNIAGNSVSTVIRMTI